jgi:hypothetical protein
VRPGERAFLRAANRATKGFPMPTFYKKFANSKPMPLNPYLTAGVGEHVGASRHDTALVQTLLKALVAPGSLNPMYAGRIDGQIGPKTLAAIRGFQAAEGGQLSFDRPGFFHPAGNGIKALVAKYPKHVLVMETTFSPYLVPRAREAQVRGRIDKLD